MSTERDPDRAGPLLTEAGQTTVASGVPGAQQARWGSLAAWTAGPGGSHLRSPVMSRPPLPAPRLETLIRHPSATGRDAL